MLYNTELKIAVKDTDSRYNTMDISIFELANSVEHLPNFQSSITRSKEVSVKVKCPICGECHENRYKLNDLIKKQMIIGGCESTGIPIYFVGKPLKVTKYISRYNEINSAVYAML
ncbi:MAG: hypothetical protein Q8930_06660 [Bacillota bacterium]|nr:hypothetical protein [Bacillota bacterium]